MEPPDNPSNDATDEAAYRAELDRLRAEHRALDAEIEAARELGVVDALKVRRQKKLKLAMRDRMAWLENQLTPDIIA